MDGTPGGVAVGIEGHQETGIRQWVVVEGQPGEGGIAAEIGVGALVQAVGGEDVGF